MAHIEAECGAGFLDRNNAAMHRKRRAGAGFAQETDVRFEREQGRARIGHVGVRQAERVGEMAEADHGALEVEADVQVPAVVALPSVDAALIERRGQARRLFAHAAA